MTPDDIKAFRTKLGLSQRELAERLNQVDPNMRASVTTISRLENGKRNPGPRVIAALRRIDGKGDRLSDALSAAALAAEQEASAAIRDQDPESAEAAIRLARQLRRIAYNHRQAAEYQGDAGLDPEQVAALPE